MFSLCTFKLECKTSLVQGHEESGEEESGEVAEEKEQSADEEIVEEERQSNDESGDTIEIERDDNLVEVGG